MSLVLIVKMTAILATACVACGLLRSGSARARHGIRALALGAVVLLPLAAILPVKLDANVFSFTVSAYNYVPADIVRVPELLNYVWMAGALALSAQFVIGIGYLAYQTYRSVPAEGRASVPVRIALVPTPLVWGWLRPTILLPVSSAQWTQDEREMAIAHEFAHLRRRDLWIGLLSTGAQVIYWFHPLVWWMSKRMTEEQELACDEEVIQSGVPGAQYANLLLQLARQSSGPLFASCSMFRNKTCLARRIEAVLSSTRVRKTSKANRLLAGLAIVPVLLASFTNPARASHDEQIYRMGKDVTAPKVIYKIEPKYTRKARSEKIAGVVILTIVVGRDGRARDIRVKKSLDEGLDKQAQKAIAKWRFDPGKRGGVPVPVQATVEVSFRLL